MNTNANCVICLLLRRTLLTLNLYMADVMPNGAKGLPVTNVSNAEPDQRYYILRVKAALIDCHTRDMMANMTDLCWLCGVSINSKELQAIQCGSHDACLDKWSERFLKNICVACGTEPTKCNAPRCDICDSKKNRGRPYSGYPEAAP